MGDLVRRKAKKRTLIVGAGEAGRMIAREVLAHPEERYILVGFLDDDPKKQGKEISGLRVLGKIDDIPIVVADERIDEVLVAIPVASGKLIRKIAHLCETANVDFRILPGIFNIIYGDAHITQFREIDLEDLLRREPIDLDIESISSYIRGKIILITGAGGTIGAELARQLTSFEPKLLILLGHGENSIYNIELEMRLKYEVSNFETIIGDIQDALRMDEIIGTYKPNIVFHTAAHKHVELMEKNPIEAVKNNVIGTMNLIEASKKHKVDKFILISTDKAVNPICIMGSTKKIAEMIVQISNKNSHTDFITVRFGNVLGSRGSVVEMFKKQIEMDGPITITHPDMERYFMTISEAVQLVIQATAIGSGGDILVLDVGEPIKIVDLAKDLVLLSGRYSNSIEIKYIGIREREKLREELFSSDETIKPTSIPEIRIAVPSQIDQDFLMKRVSVLVEKARKMDTEGVIKEIKAIIPSYER
ncbi:MAG: polysaccharide biosynthesis protein [bacterium]